MPKLGLNVNILSLLADSHGRRNIKSKKKNRLNHLHHQHTFLLKATATYKQDL
jgi:hypothetical protein